MLNKFLLSLSFLISFSSTVFTEETSTGELFTSSTVANEIAAPVPSFASDPVFSSTDVTIPFTLPAGTNKSGLHVVALLTTDLTAPLDMAASVARDANADGMSIVGSVDCSNDAKDQIVIPIGKGSINERYYIALASYNGNWNAQSKNGNLLRSGWRLWTKNSIPESGVVSNDRNKEDVYAQAYDLGKSKIYLYARVPVPATFTNANINGNEIKASDLKNEGLVGKTYIAFSFASAKNYLQLQGNRSNVNGLIVLENKGIISLIHYFSLVQRSASGNYEVTQSTNDSKSKKVSAGIAQNNGFAAAVSTIQNYITLKSDINDPITCDNNSRPYNTPGDNESHNAMLLTCALLHLSYTSSTPSVVQENVSGCVDGYEELHDLLIKNWKTTISPKQTIWERLTEIHTKASAYISNETFKKRVNLVNSGTLTCGSAKDKTGKPDTNKVAFFDGYSKVKVQVDAVPDNSPSARGLLLSVTDNIEIFYYDKTDDNFVSIVKGDVNKNTIIRSRSAAYNAALDDNLGLWVKGINPAKNQENLAFSIGVRPVYLVHNVNGIVPSSKEEEEDLTVAKGFLVKDVRGVLSIRVPSNSTTLNTLLDPENILVGQERLISYNKDYLIQPNTVEFKLLNLNPTTPEIESHTTTSTETKVSAKHPSSFVVVRAVEKDGNGKYYRVFEKNLKSFYFGVNTTNTTPLQVGQKTRVDIYNASSVPADIKNKTKIRIRKSSNLEIYDSENNLLYPGSNSVSFGLQEEVIDLSWEDYVEKFIYTQNYIQLKLLNSKIPEFQVILIPKEEQEEHLKNTKSTSQVELISLDRMVHGIIHVPENTSLSVEIFNETSGQNLGKYENITDESKRTFYVYDSFDDYYDGNDVIAQRMPDGTPVVFVRDENDKNTIHFLTIFDELGTVTANITIDNQTFEKTCELTENTVFNRYLLLVDQYLSDGGGQTTVLAKKRGLYKEVSTYTFRERAKTSLALFYLIANIREIPFALDKYNQIYSFVNGFIDGVTTGLTCSFEAVPDNIEFLKNLDRKAIELAGFIKKLCTDYDGTVDEIMLDLKDCLGVIYEKGDEQVPFKYVVLFGYKTAKVRYADGFAIGFVFEQIFTIRYIEKGISKLGISLTSYIKYLKATNQLGALRYYVNLHFSSAIIVSARYSLLGFDFNDVTANLKRINRIISSFTRVGSGNQAVVQHLLKQTNSFTEKMAVLFSFHKGVWDDNVEEAITRTIIRYSNISGKVEIKLGRKLTEKAQTGLVALWPKMMDAHYSDIIKRIPGIMNTPDFGNNSLLDDFMKHFTDENEVLHADALEKSLEKYADVYKVTDAKFRILDYEKIHGEFSYRHYDDLKKSKMDPTKTNKEYFIDQRVLKRDNFSTQMTPDNFQSPTEAVAGVQVSPNWQPGNCGIRVVIRNLDIKDAVYLSFSGKPGLEKYYEACTRSYPEFGTGGSIQIEYPLDVEISHLEYWDYELLEWRRIY